VSGELVALSLGAGVQSSALLLMACAGELPRPDLAVFADTGWEPAQVYRWLSDVLEPAAAAAGISLHHVTAGNLRRQVADQAATGRFVPIPTYLRRPDGRAGLGRRECTSNAKVIPIRRHLRAQLDRTGGRTATLWLGITVDEIARARPARVKWLRHAFPLLGDYDLPPMRRSDCLAWLARNGYPPAPRSACIGCPYRSDAEWRHLAATSPAEFADAAALDAQLRTAGVDQYLHRSLLPLADVDLSGPADHGQYPLFDLAECEGACGL